MLQGSKQPRDALAFAAVVAFAVSLSASIVNVFPWLGVARPALTTAVLAIGAMLFVRIAARLPIHVDGARGLTLLAFALWAGASLAWSLDPPETQAELVELFKLVGLYIAVINLVTTPGRLRWVSAAMVVASLAPSIGAIDRWNSGLDLVDGYRARWLGVYADPNHLAMSLVAIVPVAIAFVTGSRSRLLRLLALAALGCAIAAIVLSYSRGGEMGLALAVLLFVLTGARRLRALAIALLMAVAVIVFAPKDFWSRTGSIADYHDDAAAQGRIYAWEVTSQIARDRPIAGVGLGAFHGAWKDYAPPDARGAAYVAHNVFLASIGELGLVGFALFISFVARTLAGALRARGDPEVGPLARAWTAGFAGYLFCDLISGYLLSAHFFFIAALVAACERVAAGQRQLAGSGAVGAPERQLGVAAVGTGAVR